MTNPELPNRPLKTGGYTPEQIERGLNEQAAQGTNPAALSAGVVVALLPTNEERDAFIQKYKAAKAEEQLQMVAQKFHQLAEERSFTPGDEKSVWQSFQLSHNTNMPMAAPLNEFGWGDAKTLQKADMLGGGYVRQYEMHMQLTGLQNNMGITGGEDAHHAQMSVVNSTQNKQLAQKDGKISPSFPGYNG